MANKQIRYGIGFDVDKSSLQSVRQELQQFSNMSFKELKLINKDATMQDLQAIKTSAHQLGDAFEKSFNPKLGTVNIEKFNQELKTTGFNVAQAEQAYAKMGTKGQSAFRNLTSEILTTQREVKQTNKFIDSMAKTLGNTIKWSIASSAVNTFSSSIRNAWNYVVKLDTSLNDIRIVTGKSADDMEKFAKKANKAAGALGSATTAYTKASLIYYQQGLNEKDVQARTDVTIKAANVTGQSAAEVSEQLTAVWNGYKVVAEEAESYVDKLSAVAASTAADLEELSEGMSKVASGANAMGVDIDQLTAQLSTIVSVTRQDASSVGTALKTIFARMGDLKVDGVDEFGVSLGEVSGTLKQVGIDVLDQEGNLRDMGTVMEEVAGKWGTWTEAQQQAIAVAMAGKRQYNNLLALFENWDMYESALSTSKNSEGTLQKQQDIYMESIEARLNNLSVAGERVFDALIDSESMKDLIDVLSTLTQGVANFVEAIGGGGNLLLGLGSIATNVFSNKIAGGIMSVVHNLGLAKEYQRQYQAELEITAKYSGASDETIKKMVSLKEEELKYSKWLTEEQKQQFEYYIKQTNELANQTDELEEKKQKLQEYYEMITEDDRSIGVDANGNNQYMVSDEQAAKNLENKADEIENINIGKYDIFKNSDGGRLSGSTQDLESKLTKMTSLSAEGVDPQEVSLLQEEMSNRAVELATTLDSLREAGALTTEEFKKYEDALNAAEKSGQGVSKVEKELKNILKNRPKEIREQAKEIRGLADEEKNLKNKTVDLENAQKGFLKSINTQALVGGVTKAVGAIGQLATSIKMIQNIGNIFSDDSLSDGEKWLQFFMSLGSIGGLLAGTAKSLKTAITEVSAAFEAQSITVGLNTALKKAATAEERKAILVETLKTLGVNLEAEAIEELTEEELKNMVAEKALEKAKEKGTMATIKQTIANWALQASFGTILLVVLAIVAAILIIVAIVNAISNAIKKSADDGKKAFEAATEAARSAKEEFENAKKAAEDLKKAFEDYDKAQEAIDNMTKGTEEWRNAIQEANMQVLDLIDKYPELAKYVSNVDGQLKISDEGRRVVEEQAEQAVKTAQRTSLIASANKLRAKNSMISQQGSTKYLKEVNPGTEADRDAAYQQAIDVVNKKGTAILAGSYEEFKNAIESQGDVDNALIKALWENKDALAKNAAEVAANTAAIKLQEQQAAASYLEGTSVAYQQADDIYKESMSQAFAEATSIESLQGKGAWEVMKTMAAAGATASSDNKSTDDEKSVAEKYAKLNNIDAEGIEISDDQKTITYKMADGSTRNVNIDTAQTSLMQNYLYENNKLDLDKYQKQLENVYETVGEQSSEALGKAFINMSSGQAANFENAVKADVMALDNAIKAAEQEALDHNVTGSGKGYDDAAAELEEFNNAGKEAVAEYLGFGDDIAAFEEYAKKEGYDSGEAYVEAIKEGIENYKDELAKVSLGLATYAKEAFDSLNLADTYSISTQKAVASGMEKVFEQAGEAGVDAFKNYIASADLSDADLSNFSKVLEGIDWKDSGAMNELNKALEEQGITIDKTTPQWEAFIAEMENAESAAYTLSKGFDAIANSLRQLQELSKGLNIGQAIDEESYEKLIAFNKDLENSFVRTHEGYVYLGGADAALAEATNNILDLDKLSEEYENLEEEQGKLQDSGYFVQDENGKYKLANNKNSKELFNFVAGNEEYKSFIAAKTGYSFDQIENAENAPDQTTGVEGFEKFSAGNIAQFDNARALALAQWATANHDVTWNNSEIMAADTDKSGGASYDEVAAYLKAKGIKNIPDFATDSAETKAADNAMSAASKILDDSEKIQTEVANAALEFVNTDLAKENKDTQTATLTARFGTYQEMMSSGITDGLNEDAVKDAASVLLAREATELGIDPKTWSAYVEKNDNPEQLNEALSTARIKKLYDEVDMYAEINNEIEKINKNVDEWKDSLEQMSSKELLTSYESIGTNFEAIRKGALNQYNAKKAEQNNEKNYLNSFVSTGIAKAIGNDSFDLSTLLKADGTYDLTTLKAALLADPGNETLRNYYNEILEYNNQVLDSAEEYADTIAQSYEEHLDMTIEAFNKKAEIRIDLEAAIKDLDQFKRELDKTGWNMFADAGAKETFINALKDFGFDETALDNALDSVATFNGGQGNLSAFTNQGTGKLNSAAYKDAYDAAIEQAKGAYETVREDLQTMYDTYFTAQEELVDLYESQIDKITNINSLLNSQVEIGKLLNKNTENSAELLQQNYGIISQNRRNAYALATQELNALQEEYAKARQSGDEEMIRAAEENMIAAAQNVSDLAQEMFSAVGEEFSAMLAATVDDFLVAATGADLSTIQEDWSRASGQDDNYLDDINSKFGINSLMRNFDKAIDETDSYSAQKKLAEQRAKQEEKLNKILEERGKLSQYELDRANAEYELTLKQIALEEAQQTASKMKLTRDASGNYSYQYVADEEAIANAQEELDKAQNDLYNMDKERNKELVDTYYNTMTEANEAIAAAIAAGDEARAEQLKDYYFNPETGVLAGIKSEIEIASSNLQDIGTTLGGAEWASTLTEYIDEIKTMDLGTLSTSIGELVSVTGDELELVKGSLTELVGENSPLTIATNALNSTMLSAEELSLKETELATLTNEILTKLPDVQDYAETLKQYIQDYENYLKEFVGNETFDSVKANTAALEDLTIAILTNNDLLDKELNGKINNAEISQNGYEFKDGGWQKLTQSALED